MKMFMSHVRAVMSVINVITKRGRDFDGAEFSVQAAVQVDCVPTGRKGYTQ